MSARPFIGAEVLLHVVGSDPAKARAARAVLAGGGVVSVQALNEFVHAARRAGSFTWGEIRELLGLFRVLVEVRDVGLAVHDRGLEIAERSAIDFPSSLAVASALEAGCGVMIAGGITDGARVEGLTVRNPFGD